MAEEIQEAIQIIRVGYDGIEIVMKVCSGTVEEMKKAVNVDKVPVLGYTMWGNTDLVSLSTGEMKKRYGFVYVDLDDKGNGTGKRSKKKSFDWMKKVCQTNGADLSF